MTYTNGIRDAWVPKFYSPARVRLYGDLDPAGTHHVRAGEYGNKPFYKLDGTIGWK